MSKFIKCKAIFAIELQHDYEAMGMPPPIDHDIDSFRFDLWRVESYNPSPIKGFSTIRMKSGDDHQVNITIEKLDEMLTVHNG